MRNRLQLGIFGQYGAKFMVSSMMGKEGWEVHGKFVFFSCNPTTQA
jgi:hypothetical protein